MKPRRVVPGTTNFNTRRVTQRQFLLRPDDETNNAFVYCLAEAAQRFNVTIILPQMMSNHQHTAAHDPDGNDVEFRQRFHGHLAKCQNTLRGRWENLWSSEEPCVVEVMSPEDLMDKLVYIATNPVKDGLVERVHHWPGPKFLRALLTGVPLRAHRPTHFFREDGPMPATVELHLRLPDYIPDHAAFLAELARRVHAVEEACAQERRTTGRGVVGRRRILRQSWRDSPSSHEPRRGLRPRVAARSKWMRVAKLQRDEVWDRAYREARMCLLAGLPAVFPYGTYWLRKHANVQVAPPPGGSPVPCPLPGH
jgi:REP element-mobilizing transposase RayT